MWLLLIFFSVLGIKPIALFMLSKQVTTLLYSQTFKFDFICISFYYYYYLWYRGVEIKASHLLGSPAALPFELHAYTLIVLLYLVCFSGVSAMAIYLPLFLGIQSSNEGCSLEDNHIKPK
jgi:hypothetical protein